MTNEQYHDNLTRYYHLVKILNNLLKEIRTSFPNDKRWFLYSEKIATKFLIHCNNLCLNSAETFIGEGGYENIENEFMDVAGIFMNVRTQSDTYAIIHHLFFDNVDWDVKRLRFDLWRIDSYIERSKQTTLSKNDLEDLQSIVKNALENSIYLNLTKSIQKSLLDYNDNLLMIKANWKFIPEKLDLKTRTSWNDLFLNTGIKPEIFKKAHSFFSMYVHSNFFSVNHITLITKKQAKEAKDFAIIYSSCLICFLIDDFTSKFSEAKKFVDNLSELDIKILKSFIVMGRNETHIKYIA
jgi:hypothetical protein